MQILRRMRYILGIYIRVLLCNVSYMYKFISTPLYFLFMVYIQVL